MTSELNLQEKRHVEGDLSVQYPDALVDAINNSDSPIAKEIANDTHLRTLHISDNGVDMIFVVKSLAPHQLAKLSDARMAQRTSEFCHTEAANWYLNCLVWPPPTSPEMVAIISEMPTVRTAIIKAAEEVALSVSANLKKKLGIFSAKKTSTK